jgi:hypothetical protein
LLRPAAVRFTTWACVVIALLAVQLFWKTTAGLIVGELLVAVMALLLATTPPNALRLHGPTSELLLLGGTMLLQLSNNHGPAFMTLIVVLSAP